jgi:hypothetical protein
MPFNGSVIVRELAADDGSRWQLVEPLGYRGRHEDFEVPSGFTTDFASVPQALTWLVPRYGRYTKAAILHDYLWAQCRAGRFAWADADGILRRTMRELDVPFVRRWLMWAAVRLAGIATHKFSSLWRQGVALLAALTLVTVLGVAYLAVPVTVVLAFSAGYTVIESLAWLALHMWPKSRRRTPINRPRVLLPR